MELGVDLEHLNMLEDVANYKGDLEDLGLFGRVEIACSENDAPHFSNEERREEVSPMTVEDEEDDIVILALLPNRLMEAKVSKLRLTFGKNDQFWLFLCDSIDRI